MIDRLRQLSEPRLRQQAGKEKSQTPVERDIFIQWVRKSVLVRLYGRQSTRLSEWIQSLCRRIKHAPSNT